MSNDGATLIDLLRHGEPVGGSRYRGHLDDPLSERGWQQLWHAVSGDAPWQRIVSSPLLRCRAFAEALAERQRRPLEIDERLREIGFGVWEGRTKEELRQEDPGQLRRFLDDPVGQRPPGAEPVLEFLARVAAALDGMAARHAGEHLLVVCHAGVIRAVLSHLMSIPPERIYRINVDTAHLTRIRLDRERRPTLLFHGRDRLEQRERAS